MLIEISNLDSIGFFLFCEFTQQDLKWYDVSLAYEIGGADKKSALNTSDSNLQ